jgi:3-methyladenine DNA glycosylase AlkD
LIKIITRKGDVKPVLEESIRVYNGQGVFALIDHFHQTILAHKVKFPLLEYCAKTLFEALNSSDQLRLCDEICKRKTEGGNVILGIILQLRLPADYEGSIEKARAYIADADEWYVCDIIGERVWGVALLTQFDRMIETFKHLGSDKSHWVVRSLGAGGHYAIKKGLEKEKVEQVFLLLMNMSNTNNRQVKQGVGWAAKTTAKFHPDLIQKYQLQIEAAAIPNWFRNKIEIGLNRNAYAKGKRG